MPSGQPGKFSTMVVMESWPPGSWPSSTSGCKTGAGGVNGGGEPGATRAKNYGFANIGHVLSRVDCRRKGSHCRDDRPGKTARPGVPVGRKARDAATHAAAYKMMLMANLTLIYGLRLLPEGEVTAIEDAKLKLANGHEAHVTMHTIDGSREEIEKQLKRSLDAFFDFYPEI